jgi:hypothetical protein
MHLAPPADQRHDTGHLAALDMAGHYVMDAAEPRLGQSSGDHRLFPPSRLIRLSAISPSSSNEVRLSDDARS